MQRRSAPLYSCSRTNIALHRAFQLLANPQRARLSPGNSGEQQRFVCRDNAKCKQ
jgi:hypothetical protein